MSEPDPRPPPALVPRRSALKSEEDGRGTPPASGSPKTVQIAEPVPGLEAEPALDDEVQPVKRFRAGPTRRLSGKRPPSQPQVAPPASSAGDGPGHDNHHHHHSRHRYYSDKLLVQVGEWLERERAKAAGRSKRLRRRKASQSPQAEPGPSAEAGVAPRDRADSVDSQASNVSIDRLRAILEDSMAHLGLGAAAQHPPRASRGSRRANSRPSLARAASSDTDYLDGDAIVPDCDAWLDNSKAAGGAAGGGASTDDFNNNIIRIAHTLRLKGWRRVPLGSGRSITVERLSGALTNAVYVVTPPADVADVEGKTSPSKVLLRIYGPQVEHLIDRDNELQVLQRLARKKIGPRLLGTFRNGRFEQFFNAMTLEPRNLREPDTSRQIAKRMRELHEGMELLPHERDGGPGVWRNWDQWLHNVANITTYLDGQLLESPAAGSVVHAWKANGYVCGVPWAQFRDTVARYRAHLKGVYESPRAIRERLVFAHNDTQYGNILRIRPDDEKSPLLQAANKHKQLVVIDFEYAAANTPGLEFANHFTEWTYNYHDAGRPHACNTDAYPTREEQRRFVKAYVDHRPPTTPRAADAPPASSIMDFMLDARAPPGGWSAAERDGEARSDGLVADLLDETRLWRPANSAQWVAWGIVQASVPGLDARNVPLPPAAARAAEREAEARAGADAFDYLSYAQDRALFFWGDVVHMGLVRREDLPESLRARLKVVER